MQLNPEFTYCVDIYDIKLVNREKGIQFCLSYPQAAIFDLLLKGYNRKMIVRMLIHIAHMTETHAEHLLEDTLIDFQNKNMISG